MRIISSHNYKIIVSQQNINIPEDELAANFTANAVDPTANIAEPVAMEENKQVITPEDIFSGDYDIDTLEERQEKEGELPTEDEISITEPKGYPQFGNFMDAYNWARENKEVMRIDYVTIRGTYLIRDIEAVGDFHARTTLKHLVVVWDNTVGAVRAFRTENIKQYKFTGQKWDTDKFVFSQRGSVGKSDLRKRD